jgi:TetR/AcrR family transcriptional regulator, cholesterol catabolism regulator
LSSGFRDRMRDLHDRQRTMRDEQERETREQRQAAQEAKRQQAREQQRARHAERHREAEERLRAKHEQWQAALEARIQATQERIQAMHDRIHGKAPARGAARELLIAEAIDRFLARGFADVSMQEIADAVGVTKAAMYYHFKSKEELFEVVVERTINAFWEGMIASATAAGPLRDVLRGIIAYVKGTLDNFSFRLMADFQRHCSPEAFQRIFAEHLTPEMELRALFERAIDVGEMRPVNVELVAELFLGMAMSVGDHGGHTHRQPQPGDDELLLDIFLNGVAPAPYDDDEDEDDLT